MNDDHQVLKILRLSEEEFERDVSWHYRWGPNPVIEFSLVGYLDSKSVSYIRYSVDNTGHISTIYEVETHPEYKERGFATKLICHLLTVLDSKYEVRACGTNEQGASLFNKCGFQPIEASAQILSSGKILHRVWSFPKGLPFPKVCQMKSVN